MIKLLLAGKFFLLELGLFLCVCLLLIGSTNHRLAQAFLQLINNPKLLSAVQNQDAMTVEVNLRKLGLDYQKVENGRVEYQSTNLPTPQFIFYQPTINAAVLPPSYAQVLATTQAYRLSYHGSRYLMLPLFQSASFGYLVYEKV